jgi:hypothetical protein
VGKRRNERNAKGKKKKRDESAAMMMTMMMVRRRRRRGRRRRKVRSSGAERDREQLDAPCLQAPPTLIAPIAPIRLLASLTSLTPLTRLSHLTPLAHAATPTPSAPVGFNGEQLGEPAVTAESEVGRSSSCGREGGKRRRTSSFLLPVGTRAIACSELSSSQT